MGNNTSNLVSNEDNTVLKAQEADCVMDTEVGTIEIIDAYLPEVLPLCITNEVLSTYYVYVAVTGGYDPIDGAVSLFTDKNGLEGIIDVDWCYRGHEPCYTDYWLATFDLPCGVDSIELDSNQWPSGAIPLVNSSTIPGKEVLLDICTLWQGCGNEDQQFTLILTH